MTEALSDERLLAAARAGDTAALETLLERHEPHVWLVNTGWTGGPFGEGHRMPISATRGLLHAALEDGLRLQWEWAATRVAAG